MIALLVGLLGFLAVVGTIFYEGMQYGKKSCEEDHRKIEVARIEAINKRVDEIKTTTEDLGIVQNQNIKKVSESIDEVIDRLRNQPKPVINKSNSKPVVINNTYTTIADCKPNDTFVETWNEISKKANANK